MPSTTARAAFVVLMAGCSAGTGASAEDDPPILPVAAAASDPVPTQPRPRPRPQKRNVDAYATQQYHGFGSIPERERLAIASDVRVMRRYAEWLRGRRTAPLRWDTATVLWWLAESDDPSYVPLFVRFSADTLFHVQNVALYGLARHAAIPAVRKRLLGIVAKPHSRDQRTNLVVSLMQVGDAGARSVLARVSASDLPPKVASELEWVRSQPVPKGHKGRWPCPGDRVLRKVANVGYRCQPTRAQRLRSAIARNSPKPPGPAVPKSPP